jgi:hypothetical protein
LVECEIDFEKKIVKPLNSGDPSYVLDWFHFNTPDDYILHSAVKIDWPYKGVQGLVVFYI